MSPRATKPQKHPPANLRRARVVAPLAKELDDVLRRHAERSLDDWEAAPLLREMSNRIGPRLFDDLVNHLGLVEGAVSDSVLWAIGVVGGQETRARLWQIVKTPHKSAAARRSALFAIGRLGGLIDPTEVPFEVRAEVAREKTPTVLAVMRSVTSAGEPADVEEALLPMLALYTVAPDASRRISRVIDQALDRHDRLGADFLRALISTAPDASARSEARIALAALVSGGVHPHSEAVLDFPNEPDVTAYTATGVQDPGKLQLVLTTRRLSGRVRAFQFLIDLTAGSGAIVEMGVTPDLSEAAFREQFVQRSWVEGAPLRETSIEAARDLLRRGIDRSRSSTPETLDKLERYLPLIERYALAT